MFVIKCLEAEKCKLCEIYTECAICIEKPVLVKRTFTNGLNCFKKVEIVFKMKKDQVSSQCTWNGGLISK